ncbi:MAG TPA: flippase [Methylomirabilota bacterium]|jgi:O-antigen/teichoic acid export membrane protein|nr:flippase [Methylomirabilota bacterium]
MPPLFSILRNASFLMGGHVIGTAIGLALLVLLSRSLGDAEFGRLHLALSLAMIFAAAGELGLPQILARQVAQDRARARPYLRRAVVLVIAGGAVLYLGLLTVVELFGYGDAVVRLAAILGVLVTAEALAQVVSALFQAHEQMRVPAIARVSANAFTLLLVAPLLWRGHRAPAVATVMVAAALLRVLIQVGALRRLSGFQAPATAGPSWGGLIRTGLPFLLAQGLGTLAFRMDVLMLGRLAPAATVGWYAATSRLVESLIFLPHLLTMATFPVAARLWVGAPAQFGGTVRKTLHLLLAIAIPITVTLAILADKIIGLLFSLDTYGPSVPILRIQAVSLTLMFVTFYLVGLLMAIGRERTWLAIAASTCLLTPILNAILIPATQRHLGNGGIGAGLATLGGEIFILTMAGRYIPRGTFGRESWGVIARIAAASGVLGLILVAGRDWWSGIPAAAVGAAVYALLVLRLGIVPTEVSDRVRELLRSRSNRHASMEVRP